MERIKKSPFSLYDFLGYFIPGALFCYLFVMVFDIEKIRWLNIVFFDRLSLFNKSVAFIIMSYVLGHVINYLSSLTIERYSIWSIGYPSRYILGKENDSYLITKKEIEQRAKERGESISEEQINKEFRVSHYWRIILWISISPMLIFDFLIGKKGGFRRFYTNSVDDFLKEEINLRLQQFKILHGYDKSGHNGDFYRPIWHYYYEKFDVHASKFDNYVALYGFTRSMSFIFCSYSWLITLSLIIKGATWNEYVTGIALFSVLSYVFYLAFVKFYRRYTLEGLMCLVIDEDLRK